MNWDIVSALAELSGSVAVFITLYFLLAQLRHANMLARSAFDSESTSRITDRFIRVAENENFAHLLTIDWDAKTLGDVDRTRISYYVAALLHNSHNSFQQWKIGILTEEQAVRPIHAINTGIMDNHTAKTICQLIGSTSRVTSTTNLSRLSTQMVLIRHCRNHIL